MKNILVTGSKGFIGLNFVSVLKKFEDVEINHCDVNTTKENLQEALYNCDVIFHLAGVNRPSNDSEFINVNTELTREICKIFFFYKKVILSLYLVFSRLARCM